MREIIKIELNENQEPIVSGRILHEALEVNTAYKDWFPRMCEYGFVEGIDFNPLKIEQVQKEGNRNVRRTILDHAIKFDMAKEIAMLQRTDKGKEVRQYFIKVEKEFNSPERIMARALLIADKKIQTLETAIEEQKPKVIFADAVNSSHTSILIGDLAKILKQNGISIGQKRLFAWLREKGYLIKRKGNDWNMPTQKSMELKLFEIKESTHNNPDGSIRITKTPKVTGKGQIYFINKFVRVI
ncbi:phage antirepressor KilAC domain-containing protein [Gemella massiliensis]|uniref:phage antirepressor KilAC domain-containing protein n=1 Tax=Gemella massiliensis TaxID=1909670 RepID=UPI00093121A5|nr:phage antirepressor KilAC domain-containing protein [Gemella massiliensis]